MAISDFSLLTLVIILLTVVTSPAHADWINLTGAENSRNITEIHIEKDHVKVKLEIFVGDILVFDELIPDNFFPEPISGRPGPDERIQSFSEHTFQIVTDDGRRLEATLDLVEPRIEVGHRDPGDVAVHLDPLPDEAALFGQLALSAAAVDRHGLNIVSTTSCGARIRHQRDRSVARTRSCRGPWDRGRFGSAGCG